ncbi:DUF106 domain-containing protein [Candidatus Woesearchaeota archaeon]|nr:DUF106 domain-containing protein [Candidatus Woesearchaeota archaeon]
MVLDAIFNPVLLPLLHLLGPTFFIILLSLLVSLLVTFAYKWLTDQEMMKTLKEDIKRHQAELKKHKDNPKKFMEVQKQAMSKNMKYMTSSLKPSLFTLIPLLLIFGWLNSHMSFEPLQPNTPFTVITYFVEGASGNATLVVPEGLTVLGENPKQINDKKAAWQVKGKTGEYLLEVQYNEKSFTKDILVQKENGYKQPVTPFKDSLVTAIEVPHEKIITLNLFGWKLGWLGAYIIFSLIFSMVLRKVLKVY